jgi:hypothetical protein
MAFPKLFSSSVTTPLVSSHSSVACSPSWNRLSVGKGRQGHHHPIFFHNLYENGAPTSPTESFFSQQFFNATSFFLAELYLSSVLFEQFCQPIMAFLPQAVFVERNNPLTVNLSPIAPACARRFCGLPCAIIQPHQHDAQHAIMPSTLPNTQHLTSDISRLTTGLATFSTLFQLVAPV